MWLLIAAALLTSFIVFVSIRHRRSGRSEPRSGRLRPAYVLGVVVACLVVAACLFMTSFGGIAPQKLSPTGQSRVACGAAVNRGGNVISMSPATITGRIVTFVYFGSCRLPTSNGVRWTLVDDTSARDVNPRGVTIDKFEISRGCSDDLPYGGAILALSRTYRLNFTSVHPQGACLVTLNEPATGPPSRIPKRVLALGFAVFGTLLAGIYVAFRRRRRKVPEIDEVDVLLKTANEVADEATVEASLVTALRSLHEIPDPRHAVVRCWVELEGAFESLGLRRGRGETPKELAQRVLETVDIEASGLDQLQLWYRDARYSPRHITPEVRDRAIELIEGLLDDLDDRRVRRDDAEKVGAT